MTGHQLGPITEHPATEAGALDGYAVSCSCGERASFSIRSMTEKHGRDHLAYFARKDAGPPFTGRVVWTPARGWHDGRTVR
jgi:hypothetical protein